jgi:hypothetical protein
MFGQRQSTGFPRESETGKRKPGNQEPEIRYSESEMPGIRDAGIPDPESRISDSGESTAGADHLEF